MKTLELIRHTESQLVPLLRDMKLKELEKHAENLVRILAGQHYQTILREVIKTLPQLDDNADRFPALQQWLLPHLPKAAELPDVLAKLTVILMLVVARKFKAIHDGGKS